MVGWLMILNKKIFRELKNNIVRYATFFFLLVFGIVLIVGMVASSDSIINTVKLTNETSNVESGEFSLYVQLSNENINELSKHGVNIEKAFYIDVNMEDGSVLRIFQNRKNINLLNIASGKQARKNKEIVVEKHYAVSHGLDVGSSINILNMTYIVTGTGSVPDYCFVKKNLSDITSDTSKFSVAFVTDEAFTEITLMTSNIVYNYSYTLSGDYNNSDLLDYLLSVEYDKYASKDETYQAMREDAEDEILKFTDPLSDLEQGASNLSDGIYKFGDATLEITSGANKLKEGFDEYSEKVDGFNSGLQVLSNGLDDLHTGTSHLNDSYAYLSHNGTILSKLADNMFLTMLANIEGNLNTQGYDVQLTESDYKETFSRIYSLIGTDSPQWKKLSEFEALLDSFYALKQSISEYTDGVSKAYDSLSKLNSVTGSLADGGDRLNSSSELLQDAVRQLNEGTSSISDAMAEINDKITELEDGSKELYGGIQEVTQTVKDYINDEYDIDRINLTSFIENENNTRINGYKEDTLINRNAAIAVGVIFFILISYVLSVFSVHIIESERNQIGTLYAMGYIQKELTKHYMILPVSITIVGSIIGTVVGYLTIPYFALSSVGFYSYADLILSYPYYIFIYSIVVPVLIAYIVNVIIIRKKLSAEPLSLIRGTDLNRHNQNVQVNLKHMNFVNKFRIRQVIRESRIMGILFGGLLIAIFLLVFSFCIYCSILDYAERITDGVDYNYMYLLKSSLYDIPEEGEPVYIEELSYEMSGMKFDVTIMGIEEDSKYFDFKLGNKHNDVVISDSVAMKFKLKIGDKFILSEGLTNKNYAFTVSGETNYANSLYIFMDISEMYELFGTNENYKNIILSDVPLDIDEKYVQSVIKSDDIKETADSFVSLMTTTIVMILIVSIVLFVIVTFILMKNVIERSTFSISLLKVFGYTENEVSKLYIRSLLYIVLLAAAIGIPLSKLILNSLYPALVINFNSGMKTVLTLPALTCIIVLILVSYAVVVLLLQERLKKVSLAEVLKARE